MHRYTRTLGSIILTAALVVPLSLSAMPAFQDRHDDRKDEKAKERYYDKKHKDYHDWDDHEQSLFQVYLTENHRPLVEFRLMKDKDQQKYWQWRHDHEDRDHR